MFVSNITEGKFTDVEYIPPASVEPLKAFKFLREAVMDARIPVTKIIGFSLTCSTEYTRITAEGRTGLTLESLVQIATNFTDKILAQDVPNIIACNIPKGRLTADKTLTNFTGFDFNFLYTESEILSATQDLSLYLFTLTSTGYRTMLDNSDTMRRIDRENSSSYFPIASYHSLSDFIRFTPFDGHIHYRFYHGATPSLLKASLDRLLSAQQSLELSEEVSEWLSGYEA